MKSLTAFSFQQWIDEHRELLRPPVCNQQVFEGEDFIVMVVGGPNARKDFHYDEGPEFFYQVEGEMLLQTIQDDARTDIPIRTGEMLQLPPVFERFFESEEHRRCDRCQTLMALPGSS